MSKKIKEIINTTDIHILTLFPIGLAILVLIGWVFLAQRYFQSYFDQGTLIIMFICSGICSFTGIFQIYRREAPGVPVFKGFWPIISGLLWILICVALMAISLFLLIRGVTR
jgi:hypothetical protein